MFGILRRNGKAQPEQNQKGWVEPISAPSRGWWGMLVHEPFTGAWQRNQEKRFGTVLTYATLYACINRIASDIGKLPFKIQATNADGIARDARDAKQQLALLRRPNHYQTESQFRESWILSKLLSGNTYVLLARSGGAVESMHVLDWRRVMPMVTESGAVFYQLQYDSLNGLLPGDYPAGNLVVPAADIIHDRMNCFFHPLIGIPPIAAAHLPALKNFRILRSADTFFDAASQSASGILTAPAGISEDDAKSITDYWNSNFGKSRVAALGSDLKYTSLAVRSSDTQMVEQLKYSDEQICQPFGIPPFKIGIGSIPDGMDVASLNLLYFCDAVQSHVVGIEDLLTRALRLREGERVEIDVSALLRMDEVRRADVETKLVKGMVKTPNESRALLNLPPVAGGETIWAQHQDYPLGMLADRASWDSNIVQQQSSSEENAKDVTGIAIQALMKGWAQDGD